MKSVCVAYLRLGADQYLGRELTKVGAIQNNCDINYLLLNIKNNYLFIYFGSLTW